MAIVCPIDAYVYARPSGWDDKDRQVAVVDEFTSPPETNNAGSGPQATPGALDPALRPC